jgi:hypothetical protein
MSSIAQVEGSGVATALTVMVNTPCRVCPNGGGNPRAENQATVLYPQPR